MVRKMTIKYRFVFVFKDNGEGRKDPDSPKGGEELRTVSLRANALKGNIVLGNYGVSQFHCL